VNIIFLFSHLTRKERDDRQHKPVENRAVSPERTKTLVGISLIIHLSVYHLCSVFMALFSSVLSLHLAFSVLNVIIASLSLSHSCLCGGSPRFCSWSVLPIMTPLSNPHLFSITKPSSLCSFIFTVMPLVQKSFSKLNNIKNYLRNSMGQNGMCAVPSLLAIEAARATIY